MAKNLKNSELYSSEKNGNNIPLEPVIKDNDCGDALINGAVNVNQIDGLEVAIIETDGKEGVEDDKEIACGVMGWRPKCLQTFNNPQCLLFFFSMYALTLGT
jgi:hypothetical protein